MSKFAFIMRFITHYIIEGVRARAEARAYCKEIKLWITMTAYRGTAATFHAHF